MDELESYFRHDRGLELFRKPGGFGAYKIVGEEFFLEEIYVVPSRRKTSTAFGLFFDIVELAKERGCRVMTGIVDTDDQGPDDTTKLISLYMKVGFKIKGAVNGNIIIFKELRNE